MQDSSSILRIPVPDYAETLFRSERFNRLRHIAGGETFTVIYLKMVLIAMSSGGTVTEEDLGDLGEDRDDVSFTVMLLLSLGMIERIERA